MTTKRSAKLADGRDIFYFDDAGSSLPAERKSDSRELDPRPAPAQMRLDSLTGEWISVAAHRQTRAFLPPAHLCPLCPSTDEFQSEIPDRFDVAVFENKSPSFGPVQLEEDDLGYAVVPDLALGSTRDSIGRCEVVVFSPEHEGSMGSQPVERIRTVIDAWADRTAELQKLPGVRQVFPFENRGQEIGVTLHHPHGQIYAYPYVTPRTTKVLASIEKFGADLFAKTLEFEQAGDRVILAVEHFTAFVPFAARWPIEIHLLPHRHVGSIAGLNADERAELASVYSRLLQAVDALYETPTPYIAAWHQAPNVPGGENVRLQLQITSPRRAADKLKFLAGSESAMGAFIGDVTAESFAARLREVI
jgi:UDPglucose--hexose-1-phosphate uridylyltransferase